MISSKNGSLPVHDALQHVVEAALANEETISASADSLRQTAETLKQQSSLLPVRAAKEVERAASSAASTAAHALSTKLTNVLDAAERARVSYERAAQLSFWRVAGTALFASACGVAAMTVIALYLLPNPGKLMEMRRTEAQLEQRIQALTEAGGRINIERCSDRDRGRTFLCIQTDETSSTQYTRGSQTFRIPYEYR